MTNNLVRGRVSASTYEYMEANMTVTANTNCIMFNDTDSAEKVLLVKEGGGGVRVYHLPGHDKVLSVGTWTLRDGLRCDLKDVNDETQQVIAIHAAELYHRGPTPKVGQKALRAMSYV